MSDRPGTGTSAKPRVVIIGLGVVGAALADEFTLRGVDSVTVFEQGPLYETGGSSSHAPGFVYQTTPNKTMSELASRTLAKLGGLDLDGKWLAKRVGGLELARTPERLHDLYRRHGLASSWGIPSSVIDPEECARLWPGLDEHVILGGLYTPTDAVVKGARAVEAQAKRATEHGATIVGNHRVVGIDRTGGRVTGVRVVPTPAQGQTVDASDVESVPADIVIVAAGLWGPGVAKELLGFELPMLPMEHGFGYSKPVPSLIGKNVGVDEANRPILRHQDFAMYLREFNDRLGIGAYRHRSIPLEQSAIASPDQFAATGEHPAMHPFTWDDFEPTWRETQTLLPEVRGVEFDHGFNGIFSFTPDGGPLLGPVPDTDGLWLGEAVWVTQSAGVAQVLTSWILDDDPGVDTHTLDFSRFDPQVISHEYVVEHAREAYDEVYDVVHPAQSTGVLRGLRTPSFHLRQQQLGAVFGEANGWERPLWYESNRRLLKEVDRIPTRDDWAAVDWSPIAAAEAFHTRSAVALYDMTTLMRLEVSGPGSTAFLQHVLTGNIDRAVGTVVYSLMLDSTGGILSDVTVARLGAEQYQIGVNGHLDEVRLRSLLPDGSAVQIRDITPGTVGLGLWGPLARRVLGKLTADDISDESLKYFHAKRIDVAGVHVTALRVSYVGELGWELYASADQGLRLWDAIWAAGQEYGIIAAGRRAFNSLRLEKGYRSFGTDMTREHTPVEAGLGFAVSRKKTDFYGSEALADRPSTRRLAALTFDHPADLVLGSEPVFEPGLDHAVGYVTSADQGYTIGQSIAYAWVPAALATPGTKLEVEYFGRRLSATVQAEPLFDSAMSKIKR